MNVVSLFAGIGGFDLALERNGHTVTDQVEIDSHARQTLARHFPDTRLHEDIHDFTGPDTDIVVGGFPCQDYSVAGSRGGLAGDRGALWWQMHRVIYEARPTWVIGENVPGLVSSNEGRDFETIVRSLVVLGYGVVWRILDAQYFGVAQRRRRVFIVGHSGGEPRPEVLALGQGSIGDTPPSRETRKGASAAVAGRPDLSSPTAGTLGSLNGGARTTDLDGNGAYVVEDVSKPLTADGISATLAHSSNTNNGQHQPKAWLGSTIRRLTPLECERLQGFPDGWTEGNSDTQRYRQLGNAVAVPVVDWIVQNLNASDQRSAA